jgi:polyphenol oxidase
VTKEVRPARLIDGPTYRLDRSGEIACLRFPLLEAVIGVRHAVTTRLGGRSRGAYASANMGLSVGDAEERVLANRELAARLVTASGNHPATVRLVHGIDAVVIDEPGLPGQPVADADMIATRCPDVPLLVHVADCLPVILIDSARPAVAVMHSGWRGVAAAAGCEAVATMQRFFGTTPASLLVAIGPGIGMCCYEVGEEVAQAVIATVATVDGNSKGAVDRTRGERPFIDIGAVFRAQLLSAGVPPSNIAASPLCTACSLDLFYSHRREGMPTGRFAALVSIEPGSR